MKRFDKFEQDMLKAYESGVMKSISPTKADLAKFKAAASPTFIKERRVNIRLSSPDLMDIQARALEEGLPYQTFIASVLHKYVAGRIVEKPSRLAHRVRADAQMRHAAQRERSAPVDSPRIYCYHAIYEGSLACAH